MKIWESINGLPPQEIEVNDSYIPLTVLNTTRAQIVSFEYENGDIVSWARTLEMFEKKREPK